MAHQMSTFLGIRLHCWKMFGLSQLLDNTNTSSLSMPRLTLIRSRLSVLRVAELSMKGTPWYVARNQRQSSGEYGLKLQPRSGSATFEETYCKNNLFQQKRRPHGEGGGGDVVCHRQVYCHHQGGGEGGGEEEGRVLVNKVIGKKSILFLFHMLLFALILLLQTE